MLTRQPGGCSGTTLPHSSCLDSRWLSAALRVTVRGCHSPLFAAPPIRTRCAAAGWDRTRTELIGERTDLLALLTLLDPSLVVGDLGCGAGWAARLMKLVVPS